MKAMGGHVQVSPGGSHSPDKEFKLRTSRPSSDDSGPDLASLQKMNQTRERPKAKE